MTYKIEKFDLSRDDSIMEGWPDLIQLDCGRLLLFYNECVSHNNRDHSRITLRISDDEGYTWSRRLYIGEETFHKNHWNSIRVNQASDGTVYLICDRVVNCETSAQTSLYLWESHDRGETWSTARPLGICGYCSDKIRELSDGSFLLCVSTYQPATSKTEIMAYKSSDRARTWNGPIPVAQSKIYTFIEPAALQLKDGTIAVFLRENSLKGHNGFVSFSFDNGSHFAGLKELPIPGMHRPFVGYRSDGTIFLSYREHLGGKYPDLKACIFDEAQLKESKAFSILEIDHDTAPLPDQGYSAWIELSHNKLLMVNYIVNDAPCAYIRGYRITL